MRTEIVTEKEKWNLFVLKESGSFIQSFEWGEFQKEEGKDVLRLAVLSEEKVIMQAQMISEKIPFSKFYFHVPYGPIFKSGTTKEEREDAEKELLKEVRKHKPVFLLFEPEKPLGKGKKAFFRVEPQKTSVIDLSREEEEIFDSFRKNTRYSIRVAEKRGVTVKSGKYDQRFFDLLEKTKKRHGFSSYNETYFPRMLDNLNGLFFSAEHKNKLIAGAIVVFFGKKATYLHAASDYKHRDLCAPALMQFAICTKAKRSGFTSYDLWGIDEERFSGVSYFKKGFSGKEIIYPEGKEVVFSPFLHTSYMLAKKMKRAMFS